MQQVGDAGAEHDEIDDRERRERGGNCRRLHRPGAVDGAQQSIDGERLAPGFRVIHPAVTAMKPAGPISTAHFRNQRVS
jgi:hypothetical protein